MSAKRKPIPRAALAILVLFGACSAALFLPRFQVALVAAGFVGYVACTRRALALCRADDFVFEPKGARTWEDEARESVRAGLIAGSVGALSLGRSTARSGSPRRERSTYLRPIERTR